MRTVWLMILLAVLGVACNRKPVVAYSHDHVLRFASLKSVEGASYEEWLRLYFKNARGDRNSVVGQELGSALLKHSMQFDIDFVIVSAIASAFSREDLEFANDYIVQAMTFRRLIVDGVEMPKIPSGELEAQRAHCTVYWTTMAAKRQRETH